MKNNSHRNNLKILKIKIAEPLKEDIKILAYIKGVTMTKLVTQTLENVVQKAREEIEEIRCRRAKK